MRSECTTSKLPPSRLATVDGYRLCGIRQPQLAAEAQQDPQAARCVASKVLKRTAIFLFMLFFQVGRWHEASESEA